MKKNRVWIGTLIFLLIDVDFSEIKFCILCKKACVKKHIRNLIRLIISFGEIEKQFLFFLWLTMSAYYTCKCMINSKKFVYISGPCKLTAKMGLKFQQTYLLVWRWNHFYDTQWNDFEHVNWGAMKVFSPFF